MNIFELILNYDNSNSSPFIDGLVIAQNNWLNFKDILGKAINDLQLEGYFS